MDQFCSYIEIKIQTFTCLGFVDRYKRDYQHVLSFRY